VPCQEIQQYGKIPLIQHTQDFTGAELLNIADSRMVPVLA
jgi:hypothetical protein